jgi:hypothetical protein
MYCRSAEEKSRRQQERKPGTGEEPQTAGKKTGNRRRAADSGKENREQEKSRRRQERKPGTEEEPQTAEKKIGNRE